MTSPSSAAGPIIVWFRDDLRLSDNPALRKAVDSGAPVLCIYVFDDGLDGQRPLGAASKWWLHGSLEHLAGELEKAGASLEVFKGSAIDFVPRIAKAVGAGAVYWNRRYTEAGIAVDKAVKQALRETDVAAESFNGHLLYEPWEVTTKAGDPVKVFTPFWRAARATGDPARPLPRPRTIEGWPWKKGTSPAPVKLASLELEPTKPDWAGGMRDAWTRGEAGAQERLSTFLDSEMKGYADNRNRPDMASTSRLSPYLRFGEISPRQVWHAGHAALESGRSDAGRDDLDKFLSEIGWREFSYHLLFYNPDLARRNFNARFDAFPWKTDSRALSAWEKGMTGYPIVDAGLRQLWTTGWMHNRVRMIVASFLIKHLMLDWRVGEAWFWDTLVDADPANNAASWQWVAGSGADAAPYFRIFNPIGQGEKFDPKGDYVRQWVPEIAMLPDRVLHSPWTAAPHDLRRANIELGKTYPKPIVDHDDARARALKAFETLKSAA